MKKRRVSLTATRGMKNDTPSGQSAQPSKTLLRVGLLRLLYHFHYQKTPSIMASSQGLNLKLGIYRTSHLSTACV